ncbi:MAG TPA: sulfotransferase [Chromatiaceae bacterium]|nr:sulfotransferase [Chromatiaceae bacterium]
MSEPLFILAPPRSFTTVTCAMLGNHPDMFGLAETNLFVAEDYAKLRGLYRARPRFQHGLLRSIAELGLDDGQTEDNIETAKLWLDECESATTAAVFGDLIEWSGGKVCIDKSPIYVYSPRAMVNIASGFPDARYLHLTRHPRETCESIHRTRMQAQGAGAGGLAMGGDEDESVNPETMWLKPHLRILEFLENIPQQNKMRLRGEDFLSQPDVYLPQICEWLGVSTEDSAIDAMKRPEESPFAKMGPDNAKLGNDPSFMQSPALRPYIEKPSDLESPMSWNEEMEFDDVLTHYAMLFGY